MNAIAVRFIDESDVIQDGELVNPNRIIDGQVEVEFFGDNMLAVMVPGVDDEDQIVRTHISRVSAMFICQGLALLPVERDLAIFDQDA